MEQCHFELALHTLKEITKRFSMEDAMRAFIRKYPRETMAKLMNGRRTRTTTFGAWLANQPDLHFLGRGGSLSRLTPPFHFWMRCMQTKHDM